ncbi:hypothetical protein LZV00_21215 [Pseudomonas kielensis]|uniref:hypothetical protein n=1 Tax=Pseudomonas kielensis TaxID=2762577 RepID=UPI0015F8DD58|nr:hypothetical protein [Pseudomonas kielensis]UZM13171.1 hypothetical protein LZV00_21215 [Pseudomonas kielensis]
MNELRAHHKSLLASGKPQAARSFSTPSPTALDDISPEDAIALEELKSTAKMLAISQNQSVELSITNDAKNLSNAAGDADATAIFKQQMNERRVYEKEQSEKNIDRMFDKAIEIGEGHPKAQKAIVSTTDVIFNLFRTMSEKLDIFTTKVLTDTVTWIKNAFTDIKSTFNNFSGWIQGWFTN